MAKIKSRAALIIKLCASLGEIRASLQFPAVSDDAKDVSRAIEGFIYERLDEDTLQKESVKGALVATGASRLVDIALESAFYSVDLSPQNWRKLLQTTHPDAVRALLARKLSTRGGSIHLIGAIANGQEKWWPVLNDIAANSKVAEYTILKQDYLGLLTTPGAAPVVARYLEAQVKQHTRKYIDLAKNYLGKADFFRFALLNLAGVPIPKIIDGNYRSPVVQRFLSSIGSAHGEMAYRGRCRSIEALLSNREPFEEWRQELARTSGVVLRPI